MNKRIITAALLIIGIAILLATFDREENKYLDYSKENERTYVEDDNAEEHLRALFGLSNIIDHNVYIFNNELCINIVFNDEVKRSEINGSNDFYSKLVFEKGLKYGVAPYQTLLYQKLDYTKATLRVFIEEELLIYNCFNFEEKDHDYYENIEIKISDRQIKDNSVDKHTKNMKEIDPTIETVIAIKPFKPYVYMFEIESASPLSESTISSLKEYVEEEISIELSNRSIEVYGMNTDSLGIVLNLVSRNQSYEELVFYNGSKTYWLEENWMKIDFFEMNYNK